MLLNETYTKTGRVYKRSEKIDPFDYSDGNDTENYLLNVIEEADDVSIASPHWHKFIYDWPTKYHLSPHRADLLRPFARSLKGKNVLEIGSGCGAITRFLGEVGANVTALEGSFRRAKITAARCRDLDNVLVVCDNFQNFLSVEQYDYIILVGVLEYSNLFISSDSPAKDLLIKASNLLNRKGSLLIAIENKLGLKYWSGAPEDHIGKPFYGIENRYSDHTAHTYGKVELSELLKSAGLKENEFLYTFPDYKLPSIILREGAFKKKNFDLSNLIVPATDHPQFSAYYPNFNIDRTWKEIINNKLTEDMANSFLVVASRTKADDVLPSHTLGYIYSSGRYAKYRKANVFIETPAGIEISRSLINENYPARENATIIQKIENERYIHGRIYFMGFLDIVSKQGWSLDSLISWSFHYYNYLETFSNDLGTKKVISGSYLDLTPFNLMELPDKSLQHFDQEWVVAEDVPLRYIMFRGLYFCFSRPLYFRPPASGTSLNIFELITKIISHFVSEPSDPVEEFCRLESKYFGPVSQQPDFVPLNFEINLFPEELQEVDELNHLSLQPLTDLALKCYYAHDSEHFLEINSLSSGVTLCDERKSFKFRIIEEVQSINRIKIKLSDRAGIIKLFSYDVRDDKGNSILSWSYASSEPRQFIDIITLGDEVEENAYLCILFPGDPSVIIDIPAKSVDSSSGYIDVFVELAVAERAEVSHTRQALKKLLAVENFIREEDLNGESVRNQLALISHRLSRNARTDLELRINESGDIIENLESNLLDRIAEIERLRTVEKNEQALIAENAKLNTTLEWYRSTYEKRSLGGVIKTYFRNWLKRIYLWLLHFVLGRNFIQNRYALKYMLEYTRDSGLRQALSSVKQNFKQHGFKTLTNARKLALESLQRNAAAKAPKPAAPVAENLYPVEKMISDIESFVHKPTISVIMPTYNTKASLLKLAIKSIQQQIYENWELCIVDDGSTLAETKTFLKNYNSDLRIKISFLEKNSGISFASNEAIRLSTGQYLALFDHDDELTPDALFWVCSEINRHPQTDIIYSDECKINEENEKSDYFLKPDWSPQLLLNMMYIGHLTVYNKSFLLSKVGVFRPEYNFSQDYDLILRATEQTSAIRHIPKILYYWRQTEGSAAIGDKPFARQTNLLALGDAVKRRNINADVIELPTANRVKLNFTEQPLVSIVIPTDSYDNLTATIKSITEITGYSEFEIVPVTNSDLIARMKDSFSDVRINFISYDKPYNFSDKCNAGARGSNGSIVLFLNDDVRPLQADWIENTIEYLNLPGIGGVSPKLIYEDDSIQYAGMITGVRNLTGTSFHCYPRNSTAYINFPQLTREVSILSGACLAIKKDLFLLLGGFDAINTPSAHSDVDLSFKITEAGFRCIYTPYAELRHIGHLSLKSYEEKNNRYKKDKADIFLLNRWPSYVASDPYFPATMRDLLYHDSPEPMAIYPGMQNNYHAETRNVILVCHDLTRSGAPIMLYNICRVLRDSGFFVVVFCAKDGPLRKIYQELGVTVIIDPLILEKHYSFERFAVNFDFIICNTVVNWPIVAQMQDKVKTIWWLQEAKVIDYFIANTDFMLTLSKAKNIIGVSDYSLGMIKKYNRHFKKIYNACYDFYEPSEHDKDLSARVIFAIVGSIESRKGHDILFDALDYLEEDILQKLHIRVVGRILDPEFNEMILTKIAGSDFISFSGEISNVAAIREVAGSDVIVCPSRDDPFPVVLVEGFCMAKTCIASDATGFAELIKEDESGFVFKWENAEALANIIRKIVLKPSQIDLIGAKAREIYLKELSIPVLKERLLCYMNALPEPEHDKTQTRAGDQRTVKSALAIQSV